MKKQIILGSLLAFTAMSNAQTTPWTIPTNLSGACHSGPIGINNCAPNYALDINTGYSGDGIRIRHDNTGYTDGAWLVMSTLSNAAPRTFGLNVGGTSSPVGVGNFGLWDMTSNITRLFLEGTTGRFGFGTNSPGNKIDIATSSISNDGVKITNSGTGAAALYLNNSSGSGKNWSLLSYVNGGLSIRNETSGIDGITIDPSHRVGVGGITDGQSRFYSYNGSAGINKAIYGKINSVTGNLYAVYGQVNSSSNASGEAIGVFGSGQGGHTNYGGKFFGFGDCTPGVHSYGIYATVNSPCSGDFAGLFDGDVNINGDQYIYNLYHASDKKLKKDIAPLTSGMSLVRQLKPSRYNFRTDEFSDMHLPATSQLGLIAQELETVLPELVSTIQGHSKVDEEGKTVGSVPDHKSINYVGLIPVLISAIQEQDKTIQQQQQMIDALINKQSNTTGINQITNQMEGFALEQNIPNPFSSETVIKYTLPQQVNTANLIVYDLTGKQVASFPVTEKGASSITITSEKLAAGIYIYSIVADGKIVDSKRMVVAGK